MSDDEQSRIASPFPPPTAAIQHALDLLQILRRGDPDEMTAAGELTNLPRPWNPAGCPSELRQAVWEWCDHVAAWINNEYVWRPTLMIPPCWPRHPHIARELAVLAVFRWSAEKSTAIDGIEEWHRSSFPGFCDRMADRLGESTCRTGKHVDWPAAGRYTTFIGTDNVHQRQQAIHADTRPIAQLQAAGSA